MADGPKPWMRSSAGLCGPVRLGFGAQKWRVVWSVIWTDWEMSPEEVKQRRRYRLYSDTRLKNDGAIFAVGGRDLGGFILGE